MQGTKILLDTINGSDFSAVGVADFELLGDDRERLVEWLGRGMHGEMGYMERSVDTRYDLRSVFEQTQSVVVTLTAIHSVMPHRPTIAAYAHNFDDYHVRIKDRLHALRARLQEVDPELRARAVVDSAPVFEKAWAVRAGLGWIGRNSLLINPSLGSFTHIGLLLINRKLGHRVEILPEGCPSGCALCRDACPNGAINDNRTVDSRRCIAYLTTEQNHSRAETHGHILGCDRCMEACPYNSANVPIAPVFTDVDWAGISPEDFAARFAKSSFGRVGLDRIKSRL